MRATRKELLFQATRRYYEKDPEALRAVGRVLQRMPPTPAAPLLSLRVIESFLHTYLKKRPDEELATPRGQLRAAEISRLYRAHLRAYTKREFDLFCREGRREINIAGVKIMSNEPQLNLFYFLQKHGLMQVIADKLPEIRRLRVRSQREDQPLPVGAGHQ